MNMLELIQALAEVPDAIRFQMLHECMTGSVTTNRNSISRISLRTKELTCNDIMNGTDRLGVILWLDRAEAKKAEKARAGQEGRRTMTTEQQAPEKCPHCGADAETDLPDADWAKGDHYKCNTHRSIHGGVFRGFACYERELTSARARIATLEACGDANKLPCSICNSPVVEFAVPSPYWNVVVRRNGPETDKEYLCWECFQNAANADKRRITALEGALREASVYVLWASHEMIHVDKGPIPFCPDGKHHFEQVFTPEAKDAKAVLLRIRAVLNPAEKEETKDEYCPWCITRDESERDECPLCNKREPEEAGHEVTAGREPGVEMKICDHCDWVAGPFNRSPNGEPLCPHCLRELSDAEPDPAPEKASPRCPACGCGLILSGPSLGVYELDNETGNLKKVSEPRPDESAQAFEEWRDKFDFRATYSEDPNVESNNEMRAAWQAALAWKEAK